MTESDLAETARLKRVNSAESFAMIARRIPAIWDVLGPLALNPQPLPPGPPDARAVDLNPQPLPPGPPPETYGAHVGSELIRLSWTAELLDRPLDGDTWVRDLVPTELDTTPKLPPWLPPVEEPSEAWVRAYLLGVVCALAAPVAATLGEMGFLATIYDAAYDVLGGPRQPLGGPRQPEPEGPA